MDSSSYVLPVFIRLPYGELRQVGLIEASVGLDVEQAVAQVTAALREV